MNGEMADPRHDHRGGPDLDPLWLMLDLTPWWWRHGLVEHHDAWFGAIVWGVSRG
jgi:hypothetical protein